MKFLHFCLAIFVLIIFNYQNAIACTCFIKPPPCYVFSDTEAVFVGTVKEIKRTEESPFAKIKLEVNKDYKGVTGNSIFTQEFGTSCDFETFKEGQKYLIYGNLGDDNKNFFATSYCSRSRIYKDNLIDLDFLNSLSNSKPLNWIWGTITKNSRESYSGHRPLQGIQVQVIDDKKKLVGISDENGNIKIPVSKAGKYKVRVFPPRGISLDLNEIVNTQYREEQLKILKNYNFETKKPFIEYEVEIKANKCGWFYLPLEEYRKE